MKIVGGGLAGLSLGISLRKQGVAVEVSEAGRYPQHKVCGEFICGVEDEVLKDLGVLNLLDDALVHRRMLWWVDDECVLERALPSPARGISRYVLDERLAGEFEKLGGDLRVGERAGGADGEGIVWAAGKSKKGGKRWIGLKAHFLMEGLDGLEMHVGNGGYMGLCEVSAGVVNACGLFLIDGEGKGRGKELILAYLRANGMHSLAERLDGASMDEASFSATAGFELGQQQRRGRVCIGDSLNLIPPYSGNGMSMALESSHLLSPLLVNYAGGALSWTDLSARYERETQQMFKRRMRTAQFFHPLFFHPLGREALGRLSRWRLLPITQLFSRLRRP
ncbi:NAD(P)/FAD-dependent oxidoreductase [Rubritalea tangerina]|uniref:NAD(P)/FAD-dependent oxidoreductase n=1 Tax=Rubritalea tangerina TaxID=430798 RepID=A0ABW4Z6V0_9BACT